MQYKAILKMITFLSKKMKNENLAMKAELRIQTTSYYHAHIWIARYFKAY